MREYLKQMREEKGMTQEEMAKKIGVTRSYYARIENGTRKRTLDLKTITLISYALEVPMRNLVEKEMKLCSSA